MTKISIFFALILSLWLLTGLSALDGSWKDGKISIGKSVLQKDIWAYRFGRGGKKILVLGGIHGDETSAIELSWELVNYFSRNSLKVPRNLTLFIIPLSNPDGFFLHSRLNANGVDINRNFPTRNWQKKIFVLDASLPFGGGTKRLSEPETRAIQEFIQRERPYLIISYHSKGGFIYPELDDKLGIKLARIFEKGSGIKVLMDDWSTTNYKVTGSLSQWLISKMNGHIFVIENKRKYALGKKELMKNINGLNYLLQFLSK